MISTSSNKLFFFFKKIFHKELRDPDSPLWMEIHGSKE